MPLPVICLVAVLLGWPALKLAATVASRARWKRFKAMEQELLRDERLTDEDRQSLQVLRREAFGGVLELFMPVIVLVAMPALVFGELFGSRPSVVQHVKEAELGDAYTKKGSVLFRDPRFDQLAEWSVDLALLRYPVSSILGLTVLGMYLPLLLLANGLNVNLTTALHSLARSSAAAKSAFFATMSFR